MTALASALGGVKARVTGGRSMIGCAGETGPTTSDDAQRSPCRPSDRINPTP